MSQIDIQEECIVFAAEAFPARTDRHALAGTVTVDGAAASRRVAVFRRSTLEQVAVTLSDPDGTWTISGIPQYEERDLFVVAFDDAGTHNAEIADFISQVTGN